MIRTETNTLPTSLPLVKLDMDGTRAVTALVAFEAGARTERPEENGMAHFLEHLVFKGGEKYSTYRDVNETAERLGAQLNAYTSHDVVAFHITCRAEALMPAVDLLTDFVAKARIDGDELDRERGVVIQEIHRSDDVPSSVADKLLDKAIYGEHPLGRPVLGPAEHIQTFERDAILAFRERRWAPDGGGAFLAGELSHADEGQLAELFSRFPTREGPPDADPAPDAERGILVERRDTNQSHLRLAWRPDVDQTDLATRAPPAVYATLLGGPRAARRPRGCRPAARRLEGVAPVRRDPRAARPLLRDPLLRLEPRRHLDARGVRGPRLDQARRGLHAHPRDRDGARRGRPPRRRGRARARLRRGLDRALARVDRRRGAPRGRAEGHVRRDQVAR